MTAANAASNSVELEGGVKLRCDDHFARRRAGWLHRVIGRIYRQKMVQIPRAGGNCQSTANNHSFNHDDHSVTAYSFHSTFDCHFKPSGSLQHTHVAF
jgi:hypothetical protein